MKELLKQKQILSKALAMAKTNEELEELLIEMKELRLVFEEKGIKFGEEKRNKGIYKQLPLDQSP